MTEENPILKKGKVPTEDTQKMGKVDRAIDQSFPASDPATNTGQFTKQDK